MILDTSVLVSAFRSPFGASAELVRLVLEDAIEAAASAAVFLEYEDVLQRPEQRIVHGRTQVEVNEFLYELSARLKPVEIYFRWRPQLPDANDEMILEAAANGSVEAIVTHNRKDFLHAASLFGIKVKSPSEFLSEVKS